MTDKGIADQVYMEPLTEEALEQILDKGTSGRHAGRLWRTDRSEPGYGAGSAKAF